MRLTSLPSPVRLVLLSAVLLLASGSTADMNFTGLALTDIFWELEYVNTPTNGNPALGGQNFTTCCLKAVNEAIEVGPDGSLQFASNEFQNWITFDEGDGQPLSLLVNYSSRGQFPCTAVYNGDARGAPIVQVNYTWLSQNCPGWEISSKDNLNAWLQPLSGFLIPAVIFCLSIPRRRKLEVPRFLFAPDQGGVKSYLLAPFGAVLALIMVCADTLVWLCICFAFAGPMILSGLYEAMLDNHVLEYLRLKIDESRLTLDMRCRCLMVILIGNLDLVWNTEDPDGNGGYVDGGTHDGSYVHVDNGHAGDNDALLYGGTAGGDGLGGAGLGEGGTASFDGGHGRESSGDIPLVAVRGGGSYQAIPGGEQASPSPMGAPLQDAYGQYAPYSSSYPQSQPFPYAPNPATAADYGQEAPSHQPLRYDPAGSPVPTAASVSPGSLTPALPVSPRTAARGVTPFVSEGSNGGPLPMASTFWNQPSGGDHGDLNLGDPLLQGQPAAHEQMVVPPPPPPIPPISNAEHAREDYVVPGLFISPASAGPGPAPMPNFAQPSPPPQNPYMRPVTGFPPAPAGFAQYPSYGASASQSEPSAYGQRLAPAAPGTPFAGSGFVAAGVIAAGIGVGVSHDANRQMYVNHRNHGPLASPWQHMEEFLYPLRLYDDEFPSRHHSPRQYAKHRPCPDGIDCIDESHNEQPLERTPETEKLIHQTKTRLKTMLHCQYSFGSVVGAPVVFFLGGFIFALLQSLDTLGDEDIAEGLAFGQWYMTIPHIAIVSGLLLAGNNPNILEGVLAVERKYRHDNITFLGLTYGLSYPSCYKVASLWDRGYNKKQWLNTLIATYLNRQNAIYDTNADEDKDIADLRNKTTLSLSDWFLLLSLTMLLLGLPYILAFLTAYFTPEIGLSCRSLTLTIYLLVQTCQIILWLWAYAGPLAVHNTGKAGFFGIGGWLDERGFYQPYSVRWLVDRGQAVPRNPFKLLRLVFSKPGRLVNWRFIWNAAYYFSQWLLGLIGITAAIGGTAMQLMGVYSADICYVTTGFWFAPMEDRPMSIISTNSADMIKQAEIMWKPCAITAIVFMSVVSFVGWWYQRRMRDLFTDQVRRINKNERRDTRASRPDLGRVRPRVASSAPVTVRTLTPNMRSSVMGTPSAPAAPHVPVAPYTLGTPSASRAMSASAVSTGYSGHQHPHGYGGASGRVYGPLGTRGSMPLMPSGVSGSGFGGSGSSGGRTSLPAPSGGSAGGSSGGRTPSPMDMGNLGNMPADGGADGFTGAGGAVMAPPPPVSAAFGSVSGPSGNMAVLPSPGFGLHATGPDGGATPLGPSRRTPYRQTPSPNGPLVEADESPI